MCGEAIVIAGLSAYFFKENRKLQEQIKELKSELDKQKKENDKVFATIFNVLETHLNPRQYTPPQADLRTQEVPERQSIRKRNPPQPVQRREQPQSQRPVEKIVEQVVPEDDLQEEMSVLLQDDEVLPQEEEDIQSIDITENEVKQDNGQVVVMMMSAMPPQ